MILRFTLLSAILAVSVATALGLSRASDDDLGCVDGMYTSNRWCHIEGSNVWCTYPNPPVAGLPEDGAMDCDKVPEGAPCFKWVGVEHGANPTKHHDLCDVANDLSKKCKYGETSCRQYNTGSADKGCVDDGALGCFRCCIIPLGQKALSAGTRTICSANGSDMMPPS
jgi:hypothetical protein